MKTIKSPDWFYALLCYSYKSPLICGVYPEKEEAKKLAKEVKGCPAKHKIVKCLVEIKIKK